MMPRLTVKGTAGHDAVIKLGDQPFEGVRAIQINGAVDEVFRAIVTMIPNIDVDVVVGQLEVIMPGGRFVSDQEPFELEAYATVLDDIAAADRAHADMVTAARDVLKRFGRSPFGKGADATG